MSAQRVYAGQSLQSWVSSWSKNESSNAGR